MPVTLFEFHGQYLSVQMTLHNRVLELFQVPNATTGNKQDQIVASDFLAAVGRESLIFAHETAQYLHDFREMYGYKITPTAIMHAAALASSILLRNMRDTQPYDGVNGLYEMPPSSSLEDIHGSFEECFRCLLGMGMQNLLPRAIARMIYRTSEELQVKLPSNVVQMLQIVYDSAWQESDLRLMNSKYPNLFVPTNRVTDIRAKEIPYWLEKWEGMARQDHTLVATAVEGH
jgi:hypothetical protein